jgi:iron complex transport system substrate-binding protein
MDRLLDIDYSLTLLIFYMLNAFRSIRVLALTTLACTCACLSAGDPPNERHLAYAENFEITDFATHRMITVRNAFRNSNSTYQYALVPKGQAIPELPLSVQIIRTPVERVVVMETVYIGYLEALGKIDSIVGAATVELISSLGVHARIRSGAIKKVQIGQQLNIENMLLLQPDLILSSITGDPAFDVPAQLARSGLPVVLSAGYMEQHPLARAEWIKFIAAFFEADEPAERTFTQIANRYEALSHKAKAAKTRPSVFCGAPYSGTWHMAGGASYTAQAIHDAGGDYLWSDVPGSGAIPLDTERVFLKAAHANYWINPSHHRSFGALFAADQRFDKFTAAQTGRVYNNSKQTSPRGGNAIWESGIVHPEDVLADLIKIFHPELLPDWEFIYYEQLK